MTKVRSYVKLIQLNVTIKLLNVKRKIKVPPNVRNVQSNMMLVLPNVIMEPSNVRKKNNKGTTECEKKYSHM